MLELYRRTREEEGADGGGEAEEREREEKSDDSEEGVGEVGREDDSPSSIISCVERNQVDSVEVRRRR